MSGQWWQETDPGEANRLSLASEAAERLPLVYDADSHVQAARFLADDGGAATEGPIDLGEAKGFTWAHFRESRVYIQILLALGLVMIAGLVGRLPVAPAAKVRQALSWTVGTDYDLRGHITKTAAWAGERGGLLPTVRGLWSTGIGNVVAWAERLSPGASKADTDAARGALAMPVSGGVLYGFGWLPPTVSREVHYGLDLVARQGTPVVAMAEGKVLRTTTDPLLGTLVEVDHGRLVALYAQLDRVSVRQGMQVRRGQQLAVVGNPSGAERGRDSHLHLEVRPVGGKAQVDPAPYLGLGGSKP